MENEKDKPMLGDDKTSKNKFNFKKIKKEKSREVLIPDYILMGFQEGSSKKDLLFFLRSKASEIGDPDLAKVQIIKKDGGLYWEIHDSGSGHGILNGVLEKLETEQQVVVKTSQKTIKIIKNKKGRGITFIVLNDESNEAYTDGIEYKEKMISISSKGTGFLVFSTIFAFLGILSITLAVMLKYGIINQEKKISLPISKALPYEKIIEMEKIITDEELIKSGVYAKKLSLTANKRDFVITTGKEEVKTEKEEQDSPEGLLQQLKDDSRKNTNKEDEIIEDSNKNAKGNSKTVGKVK